LYFCYFGYVRVHSLIGRHFFNVYIVKDKDKLIFSNVDVKIILDFPITYENIFAFCQSTCPYLKEGISLTIKNSNIHLYSIDTQYF